MTGVFDIIAVAAFGLAFVVAVYTALTTRERTVIVSAVFLLLAMGLMTLVSLVHAVEQLGGTAAFDLSEDYAQALFLPLVAYMMHAMYVRAQVARAAREQSIVDRLDGRLADSLNELGEYRLGMLQALSAAVDARDKYTALHSMHVADYASAIAFRLGMEDDIPVFEQAGLLHDIGKIGIPDAVLLKPAHLTDEEYEIIKRHVVASASIIEAVSFLSAVVPAVRHHHERWDGTGYPDGLVANDIPRTARVIAVADAFDAMTTDRPYRAALAITEARLNLVNGRGTQFDPEAVDALIELLDEEIVTIESEPEVA